MEKCMYCYSEPNGDIPYGRKSMFKIQAFKAGSTKIYIEGSLGGGPYNEILNIDLLPSGDYLKGVKIKYCPMCGRKLTGKDFVPEED